MKNKLSNTSNVFWLIFFIALCKSVLFSHFGFGLLDEGESLHNATRILQGELPYRDFFAIFPPLDNYLFAFIFQVFGKSVIVPRLVLSIIFSFAPAFMYLVLAKFMSKKIAIVPGLLLILLDLNVERLYFFTPIILAIYLFDKNIFISGLLLGLTSLVRADLPGTYLLGLGISFLISGIYSKQKFARTFKQLLLFGIGYTLPIAAIVYWMQANNILNLFLHSALVDSVIITKLHDLPFPAISNLLPHGFNLPALANTYEAWYAYLMLTSYAVFFIYLLKNWKSTWKAQSTLIGVFFGGLLALPYVFGRSDMGHIIKGGMPALFTSAYLFSQIHKMKLKRSSQKYLSLFGILMVSAIFIANIFQSIWWLRFNNTSIMIGDYSLRMNSNFVAGSTAPSAQSLSKAVEFLQQTPKNQKVLALPYMAGVYFLADRQPPVEFNNLLAGFVTTPEQQQQFIDKVKQAQVNKIVYARESGPKMVNNKLYQYNPLIDEFIMANYKTVATTPEGWLLMERK